MRLLCLSALLLVSLSAAADYSTHPKALGLIEELVSSGRYQREELIALLQAAQRRPALVESERKAPEKTRTWPEYRAIFLQSDRIDGGVAYLRKHAASFKEAEARFGVPAPLIAAIIGVETRYGGYTGPHRVLDSLATQGFEHPSRSVFFFNEFREFLLLCKEHDLDPLTVSGSYAGAMGLPQFMPSNYRRLALDFDDDGEINLWTPADAIGSAGHYLTRYLGQGRDWQRGQPVAFPVSLKRRDGLEFNTRQPAQRWRELHEQVSGLPDPLRPDQAVGLLSLDLGEAQEYWLALPNFYSIMSYNPRVYYAMAVHQLSQAIASAAGREY